MKIIKKMLGYAVLGSALLISTNVQAERLRLGHVTPPSHIWHQVAERFNNNLKTATDGKDSITIFPLSKLGGDNQMIDLLQSGAMQMAILTAGSLSNRSESMNAWFLPYTFTDVTDAAQATQTETAKQLLADLKQHKLIGLGYTLAGMRHVLSSKPIQSIEDLANKKIRAFPNQVFSDWWLAIQAAPTALAIADVSSSLTTNLLDAVDVDLDIVVGMKMYQQAPYLTLTNHMVFPGVMVVSQKWWDKQSAAQQQVIMDAFKEAEAWGFEQQAKAEVSNLKLLQDAGVSVSQLPQDKLKAIAQPIVKKYTAANATVAKFYTQQAQ